MSTVTFRSLATDYWTKFARHWGPITTVVAIHTGAVTAVLTVVAPQVVLYHLFAIVGLSIGFTAVIAEQPEPDSTARQQADVQGTLADYYIFLILSVSAILNAVAGVATVIAWGVSLFTTSATGLVVALVIPGIDLIVAGRTGYSVTTLAYRVALRVIIPLLGVPRQSAGIKRLLNAITQSQQRN